MGVVLMPYLQLEVRHSLIDFSRGKVRRVAATLTLMDGATPTAGCFTNIQEPPQAAV